MATTDTPVSSGARVAGRDATSVADPAPLGLAAFAMTTFVLSVFNASLINNAKLAAVALPLALFYGGLAQLLAGMWEFLRGNTFGATAFSSFGSFWLAFFFYDRYVAANLATGDVHKATGLFLLAWTIFTAYMVIASLRVGLAVTAVFTSLALTFLLLTIGAFAQSSAMTKTGGWLGLVTAVLAWYTSFAIVTNTTWKRDVLPVWPAKG